MSRFRRFQRYGKKSYGRYNRKKSTRYNKTSYGSGGMATAAKAIAMAGSALAIAQGIKRLINVEYKRFARNLTDVNSIPAGTIECMTAIGEGNDNDERNGRSIKAVKYNFRYRVTFNEGDDPTQYVRMMVVQDMQGDGTAPVPAEVLEEIDVIGYINQDNTDRFKVLYDKTHVLTAQIGGVCVKKNIEMETKIEYIGSTTGATSQGSGQIYTLHLGTQASEFYPTVNIEGILRYIDN